MDTADVVTASIAGAALGLSILVLVLQWRMWTRSGAVIILEASFGIRTSGPITEIVTITASNRGRGAAQVTSWWLEPVGGPPEAKKWWMGNTLMPGSADLPVVVEGQHSVSWMVPHAAVEDSCRQWNIAQVRPRLSLGSGHEITGPALRVL